MYMFFWWAAQGPQIAGNTRNTIGERDAIECCAFYRFADYFGSSVSFKGEEAFGILNELTAIYNFRKKLHIYSNPPIIIKKIISS